MTLLAITKGIVSEMMHDIEAWAHTMEMEEERRHVVIVEPCNCLCEYDK